MRKNSGDPHFKILRFQNEGSPRSNDEKIQSHQDFEVGRRRKDKRILPSWKVAGSVEFRSRSADASQDLLSGEFLRISSLSRQRPQIYHSWELRRNIPRKFDLWTDYLEVTWIYHSSEEKTHSRKTWPFQIGSYLLLPNLGAVKNYTYQGPKKDQQSFFFYCLFGSF